MMENTNFSTIRAHLRERTGSIEEDFIFLRYVVSNNPRAVNYFVGEYSAPMLRYVVDHILRLKNNAEYEDSSMVVTGDYYIFIASPFDTSNHDKPEWHRLSLYRAENNARLYTYVFKITSRYFIKNKKKYANKEKNTDELLEYVDYEALLGYAFEEEEEWTEEQEEVFSRLREAFGSLQESDQEVLQCLVMDQTYWSEAFNQLRCYLNPSGPENKWASWSYEEKQAAIDKYWENKQKQDAMYGLKGRAISHLATRYNKLKKEAYGKK